MREASREHPADAVLHDTLRNGPRLLPTDARDLSTAVQDYYRWMGSLDRSASCEERIRQAIDIAAAYRARPGDVSTDILANQVLPSWVRGQMDASPAWLRALQRDPRLWLRAQRGQARTLAASLLDCEIPFDNPRLDALVYKGEQDLFRSPQFKEGEFEIQDLSSQLVSILCDPQPGETWWDACAGEGGKTLHLSSLMGNKGLIWASDRSERRLRQLKVRAKRARVFNYRTAPWEGALPLPTKTKFDGILVDAPCTGLGTWQRNPQARWTVQPEDVRELGVVQQRLLDCAAGALKPGGRLVYSVCTLTRSETTKVARDLELAHPELEPLAVAHPLNPKAPAAAQFWFWPQDYNSNGMFVALWRKRPTSK